MIRQVHDGQAHTHARRSDSHERSQGWGFEGRNGPRGNRWARWGFERGCIGQDAMVPMIGPYLDRSVVEMAVEVDYVAIVVVDIVALIVVGWDTAERGDDDNPRTNLLD